MFTVTPNLVVTVCGLKQSVLLINLRVQGMFADRKVGVSLACVSHDVILTVGVLAANV